jgi:hypothetical protein
MLKDKNALEVFNEYYNQKCRYEAECRILERRFEKEEQKLVEIESLMLDEHALVVRGQKLQNIKGEVWEVLSCYVDWSYDSFKIRYKLELKCTDGYETEFLHRQLEKGFEEGSWTFATDTAKTLAKTTMLTKLILHDKRDIDGGVYIGFTAKGKCIVFSSWDTELLKHAQGNLKVCRNSRGTYDLKDKKDYLALIDIIGVYEDYQELTTEFLI